ncbi:cyclophilin-like fold protein [Barnesiella sp. An55]|uniref:cyclophilin-like fold protein n=1 Tax=Barnesiella sp. An55 TaxID=1965646 RepID=UPI001F151C68|nr:cyclophilin-like fold protein [Barnesiella sp. An55]
MTLKLTIGNASFTATLEDNSTAQAFAAMLPMRLAMSELNGNEKYVYLDQSLPTQAISPGTIQEGDLMLYGSSCVVLFYKSFSTSYRYTRIGRVDNPSGLAAAVGSGNVTITFER